MMQETFKNRATKYLCLRVLQLTGIFASIYVKQEHKKIVQEIRSQVIRAGFMNVVGNKGAIAVRFKFYNTSMCFIMAHLAAHEQQVAQRNQNFFDIMRACTFEEPDDKYHPENHDILVFGGDLNYRIARPYELVMSAIERNDIEYLTTNDQLVEEIAGRRAFVGFKEPELNFLPTYRFDVGTLVYDTSEKKRTPSYTDRVLYQFDSECAEMRPIQYTSAQSTMISDHKPVLAIFDVTVRELDDQKYRELFEQYASLYVEEPPVSPAREDWDLVDEIEYK
jgi:endonuclease/exonuclease/phosphatase family metal-dependent hydrolase